MTATEIDYWVRIGTEATGPFSSTQIKEMMLNGEIQTTTPCAVTGAEVWSTVGESFGLARPQQRALVVPQLSRSNGRKSRRFPIFAFVFFTVGLTTLWACGFLENPSPYDAWRVAERHAKARLPVGTRVSTPARLDSLYRDPWYEWTPGEVICHLEINEPRDAKSYTVFITVKRVGRWWSVKE